MWCGKEKPARGGPSPVQEQSQNWRSSDPPARPLSRLIAAKLGRGIRAKAEPCGNEVFTRPRDHHPVAVDILVSGCRAIAPDAPPCACLELSVSAKRNGPVGAGPSSPQTQAGINPLVAAHRARLRRSLDGRATRNFGCSSFAMDAPTAQTLITHQISM